MDKTLYALFFLTLPAAFVGLLAKGVSLAVSLMLFGPVAIAVFTAIAFVILLVAVVFEKAPREDTPGYAGRAPWAAQPGFATRMAEHPQH